MADGSSKRLSSDERKAAIRKAAIDLLGREGLQGFSLEAVAREAGIALSLPRHYFGSTRDLLKAATEDLLKEVETMMLDYDLKLDLKTRFTTYLGILAKHPWGHHIWMQCEDIHPEIAAVVRHARRRMSEAIYRKPWRDLTKREQLDARGRIGYIEALVTDWIQREFKDSEEVVELILQAIKLPVTKAKPKPKSSKET